MTEPSRGIRSTLRPDPCTLMYGVDRSAGEEDGRAASRALDVWVAMATKAGWHVVVVRPLGEQSSIIGLVEVEGIHYTVHLGPRKRVKGIDGSAGSPVERPVLKRAVWVEPVIDENLLVAYP